MQLDPPVDWKDYLDVLDWMFSLPAERSSARAVLSLPRVLEELRYWSFNRIIGSNGVYSRAFDLVDEISLASSLRGPSLANEFSSEMGQIEAELHRDSNRPRSTRKNRPNCRVRHLASSMCFRVLSNDTLILAWRDVLAAARDPNLPVDVLLFRQYEFFDLLWIAGKGKSDLRRAQSILSGHHPDSMADDLSDELLPLGSRLLRAQHALTDPAPRPANIVWIGYLHVAQGDWFTEAGPLKIFDTATLPLISESDPRLPPDLALVREHLSLDSCEEIEGHVLVRVEIPGTVLDPVLQAKTLVERSLRTFLGATYPGWHESGHWVHIRDNLWESSTDPSVRDRGDFMWGLTQTKDALAENATSIRKISDRQSPMLDTLFYHQRAVQDSLSEPAASRLTSSVRVLEWVNTSIFYDQGIHWRSQLEQLVRDTWILQNLRRRVRVAAGYVLERGKSIIDLKETTNWDQLETLSGRLRENGRVDEASAIAVLPSIRHLVRDGTMSARYLDELADLDAAAPCQVAISSLLKRFSVQADRLVRARNSVTHGGNIPEGPLTSIADFSTSTALYLVNLILRSTIDRDTPRIALESEETRSQIVLVSGHGG